MTQDFADLNEVCLLLDIHKSSAPTRIEAIRERIALLRDRHEAFELKRENAMLRDAIVRLRNILGYDPQTRRFFISDMAWFSQPYMSKHLNKWLDDLLKRHKDKPAQLNAA